MPVLDGRQATRLIRAAGSAVPVLAVTGNAAEAQCAEAFAAGVTALVFKPLVLAELAQTVCRFIPHPSLAAAVSRSLPAAVAEGPPASKVAPGAASGSGSDGAILAAPAPAPPVHAAHPTQQPTTSGSASALPCDADPNLLAHSSGWRPSAAAASGATPSPQLLDVAAASGATPSAQLLDELQLLRRVARGVDASLPVTAAAARAPPVAAEPAGAAAAPGSHLAHAAAATAGTVAGAAPVRKPATAGHPASAAAHIAALQAADAATDRPPSADASTPSFKAFSGQQLRVLLGQGFEGAAAAQLRGSGADAAAARTLSAPSFYGDHNWA